MEKIVLSTSSYDKAKCGNTVSISGDGGLNVGYTGPSYKKLAPRLFTYQEYSEQLEKLKKIKDYFEYIKFRRQIEDKYMDSYYETRLKNLNVDELFEILISKFGNDIILLCYEDVDLFCHRRVIADWIELKTGIYVPEVEVLDNKVKRIEPIRYKDRLKKYL